MFFTGSSERNDIRKKLQQCFQSLEVHGLPWLTLKPDEKFGYSVLNDRFRNGLESITKTILKSASTPRFVSIGGGGISLELNSTNVEVIFETLIEQANNGYIDLSGVDSYWAFTSNKIRSELAKSDSALQETGSKCSRMKPDEERRGGDGGGGSGGFLCSHCVCEFRNKVIADSIASIEVILSEASNLVTAIFDVDASGATSGLRESLIDPWSVGKSCLSSEAAALRAADSDEEEERERERDSICDIDELAGTPLLDEYSFNPKTLECRTTFICGHHGITVRGGNLLLASRNLYIHPGSGLDLLAPPKAASGIFGEGYTESGSDGEDGHRGVDLEIRADKLLRFSATELTLNAFGGAGGDGGNGFMGSPGLNGADGKRGRDNIRSAWEGEAGE